MYCSRILRIQIFLFSAIMDNRRRDSNPGKRNFERIFVSRKIARYLRLLLLITGGIKGGGGALYAWKKCDISARQGENNCPVTTGRKPTAVLLLPLLFRLLFIVRQKTRAARAAPLPDSSPPFSTTINPPPLLKSS